MGLAGGLIHASPCRYDFTDGDLSVSLTQMQEYLNQHDAIPFKVLQFLFTEINYGGRVTDGKDRRLINNLVLNFCNEGVLDDGYAFAPEGVYCTTCAPQATSCALCFGNYAGSVPPPH